MEPVTSKAIRKTVYCFLMFFALRLVEELLIGPKFNINPKGVIACLGGLVILMIFIRLDNKPLDGIGVLFSRHKFKKGFLIALAVFSAEFMQFNSFESGTPRLTLYYDTVDHAYSAGLRSFILWSGVCVLISVMHALFYETAFRGLLYTLASRGLPFRYVNLLQAALYTVWYLVPILRIVLFSMSQYTVRRVVISLLFALTYEMITGLKLGLLRRSTGAVWICFFDHVMFSFILDMVHLQYTSASMSVSTDSNYYLRFLAFQGFSLLISIIYYQRKSKKIQQQQTAHILEESAS